MFKPHFLAAAVAVPKVRFPCGLSSGFVDGVIDLAKASNVPRRRGLVLPSDVVELLLMFLRLTVESLG